MGRGLIMDMDKMAVEMTITFPDGYEEISATEAEIDYKTKSHINIKCYDFADHLWLNMIPRHSGYDFLDSKLYTAPIDRDEELEDEGSRIKDITWENYGGKNYYIKIRNRPENELTIYPLNKMVFGKWDIGSAYYTPDNVVDKVNSGEWELFKVEL